MQQEKKYGKCPECGAPCEVIEEIDVQEWDGDVTEVPYDQYVFQPQHPGTAVWVNASLRLPQHDNPLPLKIDGLYRMGNFYSEHGQSYVFVQGPEEFMLHQSYFEGIFWLDESLSNEGNNISKPTFWDVAEAFKWAAKYRDEIGGHLTLYNDQWTLISENEDGNENETQDLTPGNVAELYCLQKGFEKEGNKEQETGQSNKDDAVADLVKSMQEYIALLGDEINELIGHIVARGWWKSTRHEQGKHLRERIEQLYNEYQKQKQTMSTEELLMPRYKVIADYPGNKFIIGDILTFVREVAQSYDLWVNQNGLQITYNHFGKYPHIFQPLPWWSDREPQDLPEYLEWPDTGVVCKPSKYLGNFFYLSDDDSFGYSLANVNIATRAEYEQYNQQKEGKPNE